jgi:hypothetical protein
MCFYYGSIHLALGGRSATYCWKIGGVFKVGGVRDIKCVGLIVCFHENSIILASLAVGAFSHDDVQLSPAAVFPPQSLSAHLATAAVGPELPFPSPQLL